ncbi:MAG: hypothetical protein IPO09_11215 [Anaeromyxobacter sp.]|nr:hypothetical protein [Anaeromyxobacter sp.]
MTDSEQRRIAPWSLAGVLAVMLVLALVWRFGEASSPATALASKAGRVDLVGQMQVGLAAAAEAEKSAVLAATDQESQLFAERSRAALAEVERGRVELGGRLGAGGTEAERALLARFSGNFTALRAVDEEVLGLAVRNTNLKAHALAFGPAAEALAGLDAALERAASQATPPRAAQAQRLADRARVGALRIQALLAPHIWEAGEDRMAALEATMAGEVEQVRRALDGLAGLAGAAAVAPAAAGFARYLELQGQVLVLSRENSNVRSLALSLGRKRVAQVVCQDALAALQQAILEEPIPGVAYGRASPTR